MRGVNIHPSIGKGRMVNAVRLAGLFLDRLPRQCLSPETTDDREGFLHPYRIEGGVAETTIRILLRDFDTDRLADRVEVLRAVARTVTAEYPQASIDVQITSSSTATWPTVWRRSRAPLPFAEEAMRRAGLEPKLTIVRGGTDGSRLTETGTADAEPVVRRTQFAFAAGVDVPGRDGDGRARAG